MEQPRVLLRITESELLMLVECLSYAVQKVHKRHYLPLHKDLSEVLINMKKKEREDKSNYPITENGQSIIKEQEHTTNEAQLYHGPLYCEKCE